MGVPIKCPESFEGSIEVFYKTFSSRLMQSKEQMERAHSEILSCLQDHSRQQLPLIVRGFKQYKQAGKIETCSDTTKSFVIGDNEPVVWFWLENFANSPNLNLGDAIRSQDIPISMAPSRDLKEVESDWKTWRSGDSSKETQRWRGVNGGRWKLCHIFQAAPDHLGDSDLDIKARFIRNFHPLNHFWFVSEYKWKVGRFETYPVTNLGERREICLGLWELIKRDHPEQVSWFLEHAKVSETELSQTFDPSYVFSFAWVQGQTSPMNPKATRNSPILNRAVIERPPNDLNQDNVFIVKENGKGRFHLSGFGERYGGKDRDRPFVIKVVNSENHVLLTSSQETATSLGIAEKGTQDYVKNHYRYTDFVKYNEDGDIEMSSTPARKVKAWF